MEPELKKMNRIQEHVIEDFQYEEEQQTRIIKKNIDKQMSRMNERLQNRKSKSLLSKKKKREKSFDILMKERLKRRQSDKISQENKDNMLEEILNDNDKNIENEGIDIYEEENKYMYSKRRINNNNKQKNQILPVKKNKKKIVTNSKSFANSLNKNFSSVTEFEHNKIIKNVNTSSKIPSLET